LDRQALLTIYIERGKTKSERGKEGEHTVPSGWWGRSGWSQLKRQKSSAPLLLYNPSTALGYENPVMKYEVKHGPRQREGTNRRSKVYFSLIQFLNDSS
jgi:hypothetical protein